MLNSDKSKNLVLFLKFILNIFNLCDRLKNQLLVVYLIVQEINGKLIDHH